MDIPMFDIKIGTMIPGMKADSMIPQLNPKGFETYELHFENWNCDMDYHEHSKRVLDTLDGRKISVLGHYGNTLKDERVRRGVELLIDNARLYGCDVIGVFAGGDPAKSVPDTIPEFKTVFDELTRRAEANGVRIAIEGCGGGWRGGSHNIIGLFGIDTRRLTRIIRETGVMNGMITTSEPTDEFRAQALERIRAYVVGPVVPKVSVKQPEKFSAENGKYKVALMDYGYKFNIRRELVKRGCDVTVFPYDTSAEEILKFAPDGIMLSNGPGDPQDNTVSINTLKELIPHKIPTFGICLGHQLLALANGATTVKLKYGHRGGNQPVTDITIDRTFITSQNHGYAVVSDSLPESAGKVSHINGNDRTCEGVMYTNAPAFTVQFHPEACGGPHDTAYLFDKFISLMEENKKCR